MPKEKPEFDQKLVDVARVVRVVAGGRRFRFRVCVVIGNKKGKVGVGIAKGADVTGAVEKAVSRAKKKLIQVPIINGTIPHQIQVKYKSAKVLLKPVRQGTGIIAGGAVRAVCELAGIENITSKMLGSANKVSNVQACILAFKKLRKPEEVAEARGKKVEELVPPKKVVKSVKEVKPKKEVETTKPITGEVSKTEPKKKTKKVAMIIAYKDYQDIEYRDTREAFDKAGLETKVASSTLGQASGKLGRTLEVDIVLSELDVANFDAVVFVGGPGAQEYVEDAQAHKVAQDAVAQDKVLAAICIAPEILAKAGALKEKKATVWSSATDKSPVKVLEDSGAKYIDQNVVQDGKIITANGPQAAKEFGRTIVEALK